MTWKLLRYDWLMNWKLLALFLVFFLVLMGKEPVGGTHGEFLALSAIMGSLLPLVVIAREDRFRARDVIAALPLRRRAVVRARYLGGFLLAGGLVALVIALQWALYPERPQTATLLAPGNLAFAASAAALFLGAIMPLVFRFGWAGLLIFLAATQLLGTLLLFASSSSGGVRDGVGSLIRSLQSLRAGTGDPAFYLLLTMGLALAVFGSYRLSARFFERSDL